MSEQTQQSQAQEIHDRLQLLANTGTRPDQRLRQYGVDVEAFMDYAKNYSFDALATYGNGDPVLNIGQALMVGLSIGFELGLTKQESDGTDQ